MKWQQDDIDKLINKVCRVYNVMDNSILDEFKIKWVGKRIEPAKYYDDGSFYPETEVILVSPYDDGSGLYELSGNYIKINNT